MKSAFVLVSLLVICLTACSHNNDDKMSSSQPPYDPVSSDTGKALSALSILSNDVSMSTDSESNAIESSIPLSSSIGTKLPDDYFCDDISALLPKKPVEMKLINARLSTASPQETVIAEESKIQEFVKLAVSQKWKKLEKSWRIKLNPDIPYYSAIISGETELVFNISGKLEDIGFAAIPGTDQTVLYEIPGLLYDNLVHFIEHSFDE